MRIFEEICLDGGLEVVFFGFGDFSGEHFCLEVLKNNVFGLYFAEWVF